MIDFDELRKEVAIRHHLLLTPDDPVLVTITLNELVLRRYVELLTEQNEGHMVALSAALEGHIDQAKRTGGLVITGASTFVADQVREAIAAAVKEASATLRADMEDARTAAQQDRDALRSAQSPTTLAVILAGVAAVFSGMCLVLQLLV